MNFDALNGDAIQAVDKALHARITTVVCDQTHALERLEQKLRQEIRDLQYAVEDLLDPKYERDVMLDCVKKLAFDFARATSLEELAAFRDQVFEAVYSPSRPEENHDE